MKQSLKTRSTAKKRKQNEGVFESRFAELNDAQKLAVETIEGPVMVVAGPGTGKTEVLGMRVAYILKKTQMRPGNILCLTYTTSGTKEMRERLRSIIGPDAYGITVSTIHSFCNDLIQQYPHIFVDFRVQEQVSAIEQLQIVRNAIKALGSTSTLYNPVAEQDRAADVLDRITKMKKEGISPAELKKHVVPYAQEIKKTPAGRERDLSSDAYKKDLRRVEQLKEFIAVYEEYGKVLQESHRYDYDDMILVTLQALKENDWLLSSLQERYQYILVDEFQDLNGAQNRVLDLLTTFVHSDLQPNIFVVGDDDQAIFRFQGANIGNMFSFLERFPSTAVITLTKNYRSFQPILDAASEVIAVNEERLAGKIGGVEKYLVSTKKEKGVKPRFVRFPDTSTEYAGIVQFLRKAKEQGVPWKEMALICRRNEEVLDISDVLTSAGIPAVVTAKQDLVRHPQVLEAVSLLRAVAEPAVSSALSAALALPCFGCSPADLGRLWMNFRSRNREGDRLSLHEYLLTEEPSSEAIRSAHEFITKMNSEMPNKTLTAVVAEALTGAKLLPDIEDTEADPRGIAGLHVFYEYVKSRCYEVKTLTLRNLLSDIDQYLSEPKLKLEYDLPHLVQDGVQLMTAHGAKGLEFDVVVMANIWFKNWGDSGNRTTLALPDHLIFNIDKEVERRAGQEDERRLFFVAMTRARKQLILTFPETYRSGEKMQDAQVSTFVAEAGEKLEETVLQGKDVPTPIETLRKPPLPIDTAFRAFLDERLKDYELSVTALNAFLDEDNGPHQFLWEQLLQRPSEKKPQMAFGTAVHGALEDRNLAWQEGRKFSVEELVSAFQKYLDREILTREEREQYLREGSEIVRRYGEQTSSGIPMILSAERTLHAVVDDVPIKGKVDRIDLFEPNGRICRVLDYKTGNTCRTEEAVRKKKNIFRQLVFYKMLCDADPKFMHEATLFTLDYIGKEDQARREISLEITDAEVQELRELVKTVWGKITALDFTPLSE
ncbi:hypothetical protein A2454_03485 [Candidatus Peribacteria bacterium RIFOXYC2_FULL_55_14]|nr:MAG: DNA-dependent ATPase I and helicase II [Candidatus Peribacteria bacterium GW2011_GWC2_54_8]OGJ72192.1 MAG: hypothetical protein A2198_02075 [Candidatus Peribacteria bacterium RIFOXYA1_FULL_56_14]OGJ73561.1 MAG: hypothetical protein A2217_03655 [Candidatus Peribacteria bacterium RIFOXYA2_FULL_55_28]OGJ75765.1 MAG: hypothetical protein A2384_02210 [Candidatus Peribacteria bacterium RIFOXYB1_FULL_54_35]OGJ76970.1 MAG: hypothetical protein A2327_02030 [Candidatus Peribacteria bacterium RIFO